MRYTVEIRRLYDASSGKWTVEARGTRLGDEAPSIIEEVEGGDPHLAEEVALRCFEATAREHSG